ncbi:MAG: signal peptide peptidase SppA [Kiritimatiellae bacterium]|nr:signal peptide peptidase SppA [Kiritimatiellia bacterium]
MNEPENATNGCRRALGRLWHGCLVASFVIVAAHIAFALVAVWCFSRAVSKLEPESFAALLPQGGEPECVEDLELTDVAELNLSRAGEEPGDNAPLVLAVPIVGEIVSSSGDPAPWESDSGTSAAALRAIRKATLDDRISGIFLEIDSPGGEITASDEVWKALKDFRAAPGGNGAARFVVALMGGTAASGAYYICAAADFIVAQPTTITGSIGVKMSALNIRGLADKIGVREVAIVSGENKNLLSPFDDLTQEQKEMLQKQIDEMHARFVSLVADGRGLEEGAVRSVADGRVMTAGEAKGAGLVDAIGYLDDAKAEVSNRLGGKTPRYVVYDEGGGLLRSLLSPGFFGASIRSAVAPLPAKRAVRAVLKAEGL